MTPPVQSQWNLGHRGTSLSKCNLREK